MPTRKQAAVHTRHEAEKSDLAPFYALAGLTDAVAARVTTAVRSRIAASTDQAEAVEHQTRLTAEEFSAFLRTLPRSVADSVAELPDQVKTSLATLQRQAETYRSEAGATYAGLAGRGKTVVDGAFGSARRAWGDLGRTRDRAVEAQESAGPEKAGTKAATRKPASKTSASKKPATRKPAERKTPGRATAAETTAKKRAAAKRSQEQSRSSQEPTGQDTTPTA